MLTDSSQTALLGNSSLFSLHQRMPWDDEGESHAARPKLVALPSHSSVPRELHSLWFKNHRIILPGTKKNSMRA